MSAWQVRAALLASVAATLCVLWWTGVLAQAFEPERVRALLTETGAVGPLVWGLAFVVLQPFGMPGAAFMIPAALVWPPAVAIALCLAGATGAGALAFALSRVAWETHGAVPLGVFRALEQPVYDDLMAEQLDAAVEQRGEGDLAALLHSGDTWVVT